MASRGLEWKVGLVVFTATVIFVAGVIYLGQKEIGAKGPEVRVSFREVGGLSVGDPVTVSGLKRGSVEDIRLSESGVIVTLRLRPDVSLHSDARISIENQGIMGEKFVAIIPGYSGEPLDLTGVVPGGYSPGLTEAMAQLGLVLEDMGSIVARVEKTLQEYDVAPPLQEAIIALRDVSLEMKAILAENRADTRAAMGSFRSVAQELDDMLVANRDLVDTSAVDLAASMARLNSTTEKLERASESLELILKRVEHGQGTLGKLSRDDKLYKELLQTTQNLNDLIRDIQKNPKRYLKLEIF
ncbi:MAG: MCE family protein [Candidatus Eisenbacteria bacterium]|nr:MCE family protein [Candidatus Eisenbacteria bacterium]